MKFWDRFKVFAVGLGIGIVIVFLMGKGGCEWLPSKRVLKFIGSSQIMISPKFLCQQECTGLSDVDVYRLFDGGDVDYVKTDAYPKEYDISNENKEGKEIRVRFTVMNDSVSHIRELPEVTSSCSCEEKDTIATQVLLLPKEIINSIIGDRAFKTIGNTPCHLTCIGVKKKEALDLILNGSIKYDLSQPRLRPNPIYSFENKVGGKKYMFKVEMGQKSARLFQVSPVGRTEKCNCP